jgi:hypothetical protein
LNCPTLVTTKDTSAVIVAERAYVQKPQNIGPAIQSIVQPRVFVLRSANTTRSGAAGLRQQIRQMALSGEQEQEATGLDTFEDDQDDRTQQMLNEEYGSGFDSGALAGEQDEFDINIPL